MQRRIDRAHRRFLSACRTLAQVRNLAFPTVVVAVADQQIVNIDQRGPRKAQDRSGS